MVTFYVVFSFLVPKRGLVKIEVWLIPQRVLVSLNWSEWDLSFISWQNASWSLFCSVRLFLLSASNIYNGRIQISGERSATHFCRWPSRAKMPAAGPLKLGKFSSSAMDFGKISSSSIPFSHTTWKNSELSPCSSPSSSPCARAGYYWNRIIL